MDDKSNKLFFIPVLAVLFVMIGYQYICPAGSTSCRFRTAQSSTGLSFLLSRYTPEVDQDTEAQETDENGSITFQSKFNFTLEDLERHVDFDIKGNDVIVFLHIQKTGELHLGGTWNFYYITLLRDPVSRYLSEWKHVQRGATWKTAVHMCDGRPPTPAELPACYSSADWTGVSLAEFMACSSNLASNRQSRMLADLSLVGCYNLSSMSEARRAKILLESAKRNLRRMAFFGLTEFQRKTQLLFECTFSLRFMEPFTQLNSTRAGAVGAGLSTRHHIERLNALDMQLYEYARDLFLQRVQHCRRRLRERRREERRARREERASMDRRCEEAEVKREGGEPKRHWEERTGVTEDYSGAVVRVFPSTRMVAV